MTSCWKRICAGILCLASASMVSLGSPAYAALGDDVTNIATISVDTPSGVFQFQTNPATFMIEAQPTPSDIKFYRPAPNAPNAFPVVLKPTEFSPSGSTGGPFLSLGGGGPSAPSQMLIPSDIYLSGENVIVGVTDTGQNGDPLLVESIVATISTDGGDSITLRLFENGPNTGEFFANFPTSPNQTPSNDPTLTAPKDTVLTATYVDAFDTSEVSVATALVDPFGRLFDSFTGDLIDDVEVTLVEAATGQPAAVFGLDGVSSYPSTVTTGGSVTDESGFIYDLGAGEFLFPLVAPGDYRLVIGALENHSFPSLRAATDFEGLQNAPFEIIAGSYGDLFTVPETVPVQLDVPLDPNGELVVRKDASVPQAAIGDFVGYTVELENIGDVAAPYVLQDVLPRGFRYVSGTARQDNVRITNPDIAQDGRTLSFAPSFVPPGETQKVTYIAAVGPGVPEGSAINTAIALSASGVPVSNTAEAEVLIKEDFFNSTLTIVGRVADAACKPDEPWARSIEDGVGVAGVRLYMESGRYVVTDADGLYHFEGIEPGTHVVQVDRATLPQGYEPVLCEENTRFAGSALSKFVDAAGGTVWRANFYLKQTADSRQRRRAGDEEEDAPAFMAGEAEVSEQAHFDEAWLAEQTDPTPRWVYPAATDTPRGRSIDVGIIHAPGQRLELRLNGLPAGHMNFAGQDLSPSREVAISRWTGIDIQRGENTIVAEIRSKTGELITQLERNVWFVDEVHKATLVADQTIAVADGRTKPVIAIRLEDTAGHAVHGGRIVDIDVASPYRLAQAAAREIETPISAAYANVAGVPVSTDGIAFVELEPTLQAGRVSVAVKLHDDRIEHIDVWLTPEKREWVLVGLAEAEGLLRNTKGNAGEALDGSSTDGRVAFFAKGMIKGDWLLTLAVDTAKRRGASEGEIFDEIDPNAYYTLYGDRTWQYNDAASSYPVYVKLERDAFQALFGDFDTDLNDTQLGEYARKLSGLKVDYQGERTSFTGFAAETSQTFRKDEIPADGTSGPFQIAQAPIIRASETVTIETRDRIRPDEVIAVTTLSRDLDYEIDYVTGELFFRYPVAAADAAFNANVIVVDYETNAGDERGITAGGRVALHAQNNTAEVGLTLLTEEDGTAEQSAPSRLVAADATWQASDNTQIRAEIASSSAETASEKTDGTAWLVEATRNAEGVAVTGYAREESEGFGLGQQSAATAAIRRIGVDLSVELGAVDTAGGSDRAVRQFNGQLYSENNLSTDARRQVAEFAFTQQSQALSASIGLRGALEQFDATGETRDAAALVTGVSKTFADHGLTLSAAHDQPLVSGKRGDDDVSIFPQRTSVGLDKTLGRRATLNLRHEMFDGADASGENTIAALNWAPWTGGQVNAATDFATQDSSKRLGATVGVDQAWQATKHLTISGGMARRANLQGGEDRKDPTEDGVTSLFDDGAESNLVENDEYTSGYLGAGYRGDKTALSGRVEARDSALGDRLVTTIGGAREVSKELSFSAAIRHQKESLDEAPNTEALDARIGAALRPRGEGLIILNRFDVGHSKIKGEFLNTKAVNNLTLNMTLGDKTQASVFHGIKYTKTMFESDKVSGFAHLLGGEVRHDITRKVDLGIRGSVLESDATKTREWSIGPTVGFTPKKNVWVSLGWNVEGFDDKDFEAAEYSRKGPYIKLRAKFDQDTLQGLVKNLGLGAE